MKRAVFVVSCLAGVDARGQEITASSVGSDGDVLVATQDADGGSTLLSVDPYTFASIETSLDGEVSDLEKYQSDDVVAFLDGLVRLLETGEEFAAPFDEVHAVALSRDYAAFGNTGVLAVCDRATGTCTFIATAGPVTDLSFLPGSGLLAVVSGGEVRFLDGTTEVARLRNSVDGVGITSLRVTGEAIGVGVGPCMVIRAEDGSGGTRIAAAGVRFVPWETLEGVEPLARARQAVMLGTLKTQFLAGDLVLDVDGRIVHEETGDVLGELTGVSIFPTAVKTFHLGPPLVALGLGGWGVFIDRDGAGPLVAEVLVGDVVHFADPRAGGGGAIVAPRDRAWARGGGANRGGTLPVHIEIPGAFIARLSLGSVRLGGVRAVGAGGLEDDNDNGEPDRALRFPRAALAATLGEGTSTVALDGRMSDGTPIRGEVELTVR